MMNYVDTKLIFIILQNFLQNNLNETTFCKQRIYTINLINLCINNIFLHYNNDFNLLSMANA